MIIIHDYFFQNGGGENLIKSISSSLNLKIYTAVNKSKLNNKNIKSSFFTKILSLNKFLIFIYYFFFFKIKTKKILLFSGNHCCFSIKRCKAKQKILYAHSLPKILFNALYLNYNSFLIPSIVQKMLIEIYFENIKNLDKIIFNSNRTKQKFLMAFPTLINTHKLEILYPFSDLPLINSYFIKPKSKIKKIIINSRHHDYKNIKTILLKTYQYVENKKNIKIIVTQYGDLTNELKNIFKNKNSINFVGYLSLNEYKKLISSASVVIFPSDDEDFGISALDAYNLNIPVVIKKNCGFKEILHKNYPFFYDDTNLNDILDLVLNNKNKNFFKNKKNFKEIFLKKLIN